MSEQPTKEERRCKHELVADLCIRCVREERDEAQRDSARWANAHRVASLERDQYKRAAAENLQRVVDIQADRDRLQTKLDGLLSDEADMSDIFEKGAILP